MAVNNTFKSTVHKRTKIPVSPPLIKICVLLCTVYLSPRQIYKILGRFRPAKRIISRYVSVPETRGPCCRVRLCFFTARALWQKTTPPTHTPLVLIVCIERPPLGDSRGRQTITNVLCVPPQHGTGLAEVRNSRPLIRCDYIRPDAGKETDSRDASKRTSPTCDFVTFHISLRRRLCSSRRSARTGSTC